MLIELFLQIVVNVLVDCQTSRVILILEIRDKTCFFLKNGDFLTVSWAFFSQPRL